MAHWMRRSHKTKRENAVGRFALAGAISTGEVVVRQLEPDDGPLVAELAESQVIVHGDWAAPEGPDQAAALISELIHRRDTDQGNGFAVTLAGRDRLESVVALVLSGDFVGEIATMTRDHPASRRAAVDGMALIRDHAHADMGLVRIWGDADHIDYQTRLMFRDAGFTVEDRAGGLMEEGPGRYSSIT